MCIFSNLTFTYPVSNFKYALQMLTRKQRTDDCNRGKLPDYGIRFKEDMYGGATSFMWTIDINRYCFLLDQTFSDITIKFSQQQVSEYKLISLFSLSTFSYNKNSHFATTGNADRRLGQCCHIIGVVLFIQKNTFTYCLISVLKSVGKPGHNAFKSLVTLEPFIISRKFRHVCAVHLKVKIRERINFLIQYERHPRFH